MPDIASINPGAVALQSLFQSTGSPSERNQVQTARPAETVSLQSDSGQRILAGQLQQAVSERLTIQASASLQGDGNDFSPQAVTNRLVGFIENALRGASDAQSASTLLQQAEAGIQQGLNEARDILSGLNVLNDVVAQGVDRTETLLQAGLQSLQQQVSENVLSPGIAAESARLQQTSAARLEANTENALGFEVLTQEGDVIQIEVQRREGLTVSTIQQSGGQDEGNSQISINRFVLSNFEVAIQGELNPEEAVAVQDLVSSVQDLAGSFFSNNLDQVLAAVPGLQFDTSQLSAFSLNLSQSVTLQETYAVSQGSSAQLREGLPQVVNFLNGLSEAGQQTAERLPFEEPRQFIDELLASFIRLDERFQTAPAAQRQTIDSLVEQLYS